MGFRPEVSVKDTEVSICSRDGTGEPLISDKLILLNGDASKEEDFESFELGPDEWFCKTARYPYDEVVTAILSAAIYTEAPGWKDIRSDGFASEWADGVKLFVKAYRDINGKAPDTGFLCRTIESQLGERKNAEETLSKIVLGVDRVVEKQDDKAGQDAEIPEKTEDPGEKRYYVLSADSDRFDISVEAGPMYLAEAKQAIKKLGLEQLDRLAEMDFDDEADWEASEDTGRDRDEIMKELLDNYRKTESDPDELKKFLSSYDLDFNDEDDDFFAVFDFNRENSYIWRIRKI